MYVSKIAATGHSGMQAPQSMQRSGTMTCMPLRSPKIASVGQIAAQAVLDAVAAAAVRFCGAEDAAITLREGEEAVSFILIRSGRAEIRHTGEDGDEIKIHAATQALGWKITKIFRK